MLTDKIMCPCELQARFRQATPTAMFGARLDLQGQQAHVQLELRCERLKLRRTLHLSGAPQAEQRSTEVLRSEWSALVTKAFCESGRGTHAKGAC